MKDEDFAFHIGALVGFSIGFFQVFSLVSPSRVGLERLMWMHFTFIVC